MAHALLWLLHLAFTLLTAAALLGHAARLRGRPARTFGVALATLPMLAVNGWLAWMALSARFQLGVLHAPWIAAVALLALQVLGLVALAARASRRSAGASWPVGALAFGAIVAFALDVTTFWNLELQARLWVADVRLEAGRITYREGAPAVRAEDNAAPVYARVADELFGGADFVDWKRWTTDPNGASELDTNDPELRAALQRCATGLAEVRTASQRMHCQFERAPDDDSDWVAVPKVLPLLQLAQALELEARIRIADGDTGGALDDTRAMFAMASHLAETPILIATMVASVVRTSAVTTLAQVLSDLHLSLRDLDGFAPRLAPPLASVAPRVLAMEEAYGLGTVGLLAQADAGLTHDAEFGGFGRLDAALYKVFLLEDDVRGYRETMREAAALAAAPVAELRRAAEQPVDASRIRGRGILASLMVSNFAPGLLELHRSDARMSLVPAALAAARLWVEQGRYPTSAEELGLVGVGMRVDGDGAVVRLVREGLADLGEPVELSLPAGRAR